MRTMRQVKYSIPVPEQVVKTDDDDGDDYSLRAIESEFIWCLLSFIYFFQSIIEIHPIETYFSHKSLK